MTIAEIISILIFIICLWLILTEKLHRSIVGIAGAAVMVGVGKIMGFYSESEALASVDFNTLGLLFGMMILIALLEPTGFFQYLAVQAGRFSKGRPVRLLVLMGTITTILSMVLPNVTTVVMIAPITILICEILGTSPAPYLVAEALLSDTGGVATLIGDPPNILIGSAAGFSFLDFIIYAMPIVLITWLVALLLLRWLFRKEMAVPPSNVEALMSLDPKQALNDAKTAKKVLILLGFTIFLFIIQHFLDFSLAYVALLGSGMALVWVQPDISKTLEKVEWSVLIFFIALFILVGGLEASGVLGELVHLLDRGVNMPPVMFGVILIWVIAGLSAVVDNVPITIAMIPIIQGLGAQGMSIGPLWWALAFGAGFGGNGTIIGSTANIIVATLSEKTHTPITAKLWNKRGLPVMLATCLVASILFVIAYPLFPE